jgi:hypothetical protein
MWAVDEGNFDITFEKKRVKLVSLSLYLTNKALCHEGI